jgi:6-bladed beta-propeller
VANSVRILALSAACLACGESDPGVRRLNVTRTDSGGIAIVDIPRAALAALPVRRVAEIPAFAVGVAEGPDEELFGRVSDALLLPESRLAVVDDQRRRIVLFDSTGAFMSAIGREGRGPGEFVWVRRIAWIGDTLFADDLDRIQAFRLDGTPLDSRRVTGGIELQMGTETHPPGRFTAPRVYWVTEHPYPRDVQEGDGPFGVLQIVARSDTAGGTRMDTLRSAPGFWVWLSPGDRAAAEQEGLRFYAVGNVVPHPLAPTTHVAFFVDRPVTGWSAVPELHVRDEAGIRRRIIRFDTPPAEIWTDDDRASAWAVHFQRRRDRPVMRRAWRVLHPPSEPARFHDLRTHGANDVWVAIAPEDPGSGAALWTRWLHLAADGTPLEWLIAPPAEILDLTPHALVALERDELDVPRVAVYRVLR